MGYRFRPMDEIGVGEDQYHEYKRSVENPERIAGEIVAFANGDGGVLYVGVDDKGKIVGLDAPDALFQQLTNICRDRCIPPVSPILEQHQVGDLTILTLTVSPELNRAKPYRTAGGRFYIRVGKDKKDATGRELMRIAQGAGELHYDEGPVLGADMAELSPEAFQSYHQVQFDMTVDDHLAQANVPLERLLGNLRVLHEVDGDRFLTVAGLLLFGRNPQHFLPQSRISAVAFSGADENSDILDRHEISGRIPQMIEHVRTFLRRNIPRPAKEHGFEREDIHLYDRTALGEAVINAIAHRDYSLSGSQIRLFLFKDRFEVRSPGKLPNSITLENIRLGMHSERNRSLVTMMTQMGFMSAIGTGIPRLIIRLSKKLSGREPEFELIGEELRVKIWANLTPICLL